MLGNCTGTWKIWARKVWHVWRRVHMGGGHACLLLHQEQVCKKSYWNKIIWRWFLSSIVHVITFQDGTKERKSSGAKCILPRPHQLFHLKEIFHAFNTSWPTISPLAKPMVPLLIHCVRLHIHMCHIIVHIYFSIYSHGSIFKLYYCDTISHTKVQLWTLNEYQSSSSCVL